MEIEKITNDNFKDKVLECETPVLVDFYADWCGPCRMLRPILEELAKESPNYKIVSVNVDDCEDLAQQYHISSIPCLVVLKEGKEVKRSVGLRPKSDVEAMMENL